MSSKDDDEALIAAALNGSTFAWEKLVRRYESRIYNHGLRLMGNPTDAMDLMQEVFLGVYRNLHRFRGDAKFSSWIFRIAHNKAVDLSRRKRLLATQYRNDAAAGSDGLEPIASAHDEPDQQLGIKQRNTRISALLESLPLQQRLIVELKIFQSLTFDEIAQMQEISSNTAKTRFYGALKKLKMKTEETDVLP